MARKMIEYRSLQFKAPVRILRGVPPQVDIEAVQGIRLLRLIEDSGPGDLVVTGPNIAEGTEVPWHNVASAVRDLDPKDGK
jgi:hypothetical protein